MKGRMTSAAPLPCNQAVKTPPLSLSDAVVATADTRQRSVNGKHGMGGLGLGDGSLRH
ncbi:hypothetical protein RvY_02719 [Ramazzottius varieornatus]|uniref:Uncharacterized protein n=1 Tax=Ramazzottius varieornatus TaxID=947166 RepID=A0A1D1ULG9_RAMVA|nr:hypothetical protein RvY_02719 [Ramazzottius varieornatus]